MDNHIIITSLKEGRQHRYVKFVKLVNILLEFSSWGLPIEINVNIQHLLLF